MPSGGDDSDGPDADAPDENRELTDGETVESPDGPPPSNAEGESSRTDANGGLPRDGSGGEPVEEPEAEPVRPDRPDGGIAEWVRWFRRTDHAGVTFLREFLGSMLAVALVGMLLFAISGVWPPMVAVKSDSMEPHMHRGDLIFVMEEHRLTPQEATGGTGVVTFQAGQETGYERFGEYGDVIIYRKNGQTGGIPIIHRARLWVEEGENWYDEADPAYRGSASNCEALANCPAPHAGFITKGDNNGRYDQVSSISTVVKPEWIKGTAEVRIPWLGHVRLQFSSITPTPVAASGTQQVPVRSTVGPAQASVNSSTRNAPS